MKHTPSNKAARAIIKSFYKDFSKIKQADQESLKEYYQLINNYKETDLVQEKRETLLDMEFQRKIKVGKIIETPCENKSIEIIQFLAETQKAYVYQVKDISTQQLLSLKILKENKPLWLGYLYVDFLNMSFFSKNPDIKVPQVVEHGGNYFIKEWIEGMSGLSWVDQWATEQFSPNNADFQSLLLVFQKIISTGIHVPDLSAGNFVLTEKHEWYIVDCNQFKQDKSRASLLIKYEKGIFVNWLENNSLSVFNKFYRFLMRIKTHLYFAL